MMSSVHVLTRSLLALQISELASTKKSTAIHFSSLKTRKIRGKTEKTVAPGEINLQSKHRKTAIDFAHFKLNYTFK